MSIMENKCVMEIIEYYKEEFKENLRKALTPFLKDLENPIEISFTFSEV